jgi:hypothetical protein
VEANERADDGAAGPEECRAAQAAALRVSADIFASLRTPHGSPSPAARLAEGMDVDAADAASGPDNVERQPSFRNTYRMSHAAVRAASALGREAVYRSLPAAETRWDYGGPPDRRRQEEAALAERAKREAAAVDGELCALLRDLIGDPFRPAPAVDPSWLAWNDGTVAKLAAAIYEERRFADLPILADALEDAGCSDAAILAHCRGPGEHVRGCWVVDLLTGRQ